jgi:alpha/beta superfamily hydrolase
MVEKSVTFKCENEQIIEILHLPENQKFSLIIIVHRLNSNKLGSHFFFVRVAREFAKNGFGVLRFDFRGSGDFEGNYNNQTVTSILKNLETVISNVSEIREIEKICLIEYTRGAYLSLLQTSRDERIDCVIVWCGSIQEEILKGIILDEIERNGYVIFRNFLITKKYVEDYLKYYLDFKKIKVPLGFIYGEFA